MTMLSVLANFTPDDRSNMGLGEPKDAPQCLLSDAATGVSLTDGVHLFRSDLSETVCFTTQRDRNARSEERRVGKECRL